MDILVYDASNAAHRSRNVIDLSIKDMDVSTIYGVVRIVLAGLKDYQPDAIVVCYDRGYPHQRKLFVPTYKMRRRNKRNNDEVDWNDFYRQIDTTKSMFRAMGMVVAEQHKLEADDLIAACSRILRYDQMIIVTSDGDMHQLVSDTVSVWNPIKGKMYDPDEVLNEYGVQPSQVSIWKALTGDSTDGIPGVSGIGPKTATKIIVELDIQHGYELHNKLETLSSARFRKLINDSDYHVQRGEFAISLRWDAHGANFALWKAIEEWQKYDAPEAKRLLFKYAFSSVLADTTATVRMRQLVCPEFQDDVKFQVKTPARKEPVHDKPKKERLKVRKRRRKDSK